MSDVYYKILLNAKGKFTVVCLQDFDEVDYNQERFLTRQGTDEQARFYSEEGAKSYLNTNIKSQYIDEEYKIVSFEKYYK